MAIIVVRHGGPPESPANAQHGTLLYSLEKKHENSRGHLIIDYSMICYVHTAGQYVEPDEHTDKHHPGAALTKQQQQTFLVME